MPRYKVHQSEKWITERIVDAGSEDEAKRLANSLAGDATVIKSQGATDDISLSRVMQMSEQKYFRVYAFAQVSYSIIVLANSRQEAHQIAKETDDEWEPGEQEPGTWKVRLPDFIEEVDESELEDYEEEEEEEEEEFYDDAVARNCIAAVDEIYEILWPNGDADHEWNSQTLADIADALRSSGLEVPEG